MRIYVACLASYNNGVLHGRWIDASEDVAEMNAKVQAMLRESKFPNVNRQDYFCDDCGESVTVTLGYSRQPNDGQNCEHCGKPMRALNVYSSAEEWAIHDHEGLGDLGEYAGLDEVAKRVAIADLAEERNIPLAILLEYANDRMTGEWDSDDLESSLDDHYCRSAESWKDFAEEWTRETYDMSQIPEWLENHIDWESVGNDLQHDFTTYRDGQYGELHIFYAH